MKSHEINGGKKKRYNSSVFALWSKKPLYYIHACSPFPIPVYLKDKLYCKDVCQRNSGKL